MNRRSVSVPVSRSVRGFTLVELLVVICILGVLMSLAIVGIQRAFGAGKVSYTQSMINALDLAIDKYSTSNGEGIPVSLTFVVPTFEHDRVNCGIETVLMVLRSPELGGPYFDVHRYADRIKDEDDTSDARAVYEALNVPGSDRPLLLELVDSWGNPLAYIPRESFGEKFEIMDANGNPVTIEAVDHDSLGLTQAFLLWSFGPDGVNQNGGGDDIRNWEIRDAE